MIPVLIVLGSAAASAAGLFVGAAATAAAHEVVQESKDELNAINADMQKMTEDANSAIASCKEILLQVPVIWRLLLLRKTFTSWT